MEEQLQSNQKINSSIFNPYELLEVSKTDNIQTIEKNFKKLAFKYHPDKNKDPKAKEMFENLSKARDILKNPEKKEKYDKYGICDENDEINMNEQMQEELMIKYKLKEVIQINISIREALNGFNKKLQLNRFILNSKTKEQKIEPIEIEIKYDSTKPINKPIIFEGKGKQLDEKSGDMIIILCPKQDNTYKINPSSFNIITRQKISLAQSLCGFEMIIPHIQNKPIIIQHDKIIKPDNIYIIKGMGLSKIDENDILTKSDIEIHFDIQYDISATIKKLKHAFNYNYTKSEPSPTKQIHNIEEKISEDDDENFEIFNQVFNNVGSFGSSRGPKINIENNPSMQQEFQFGTETPFGVGFPFNQQNKPNIRTKVYSSSQSGNVPNECKVQ